MQTLIGRSIRQGCLGSGTRSSSWVLRRWALQRRSLSSYGDAESLYVIISGPPGSGKGTICKRIARDFKFRHISSGDMLRSQISKGTKLGIEASAYMDSGALVPDELVIDLVKDELREHRGRLLLDGFPRTKEQYIALESDLRVELAIDLQVPFREIIERMSERWIHEPSGRIYSKSFSPPRVAGKDDETGEALTRRPDDEPENVERRLDAYEAQSQPIRDHYRELGILCSFDGKSHPEMIANDRRSDAIYNEVYSKLESTLSS